MIGVRRASDRAEPVEGRDAHAAHGVRVGRSTRELVGELEPEVASHRLGLLHQPSGGAGLLQRGEARAGIHLDLHAIDRTLPRDALDLRDGLAVARQRRCPQVEVEVAPVGDHVRPGAAVHDADVEGDAGPPAVQRVDRHDRVRALEDRRRAAFGFDPRVGGAAADRDLHVGDALAARDDRTALARRLQDEADVDLLRAPLDGRRGERRPDLLVGVADVGDRSEVPVPQLLQRAHRVEPRQEPALHVGDPWTVGHVALDPEPALGRGALREHGIHVPDQQDPAASTVGRHRPRQSRHDHVAEDRRTAVRRVLLAFDRPTRVREALAHEVGDAVHPVAQERAAVDADERAEVFEVCREPVFEDLEELGGVDGVRRRHSPGIPWSLGAGCCPFSVVASGS